jgi:hypothetical protein
MQDFVRLALWSLKLYITPLSVREEGGECLFPSIAPILGSIVRAAMGVTVSPAKSGRQPPVRRSAKSQAVADPPIGARGCERRHLPPFG